MDSNSDFNELLDSPVGLKTIRKKYFDIIEWTIMIINGIFTFLGVILFWKVAYESSTWLLYINPPCFILLFGLTPIIYIRKWRIASTEYDNTNNSNLLRSISTSLISFVQLGTGFICTLIALMLLGVFYGAENSISAWFNVGVLVLLAPFIILGPVQFLFIRTTKKIINSFSEDE